MPYQSRALAEARNELGFAKIRFLTGLMEGAASPSELWPHRSEENGRCDSLLSDITSSMRRNHRHGSILLSCGSTATTLSLLHLAIVDSGAYSETALKAHSELQPPCHFAPRQLVTTLAPLLPLRTPPRSSAQSPPTLPCPPVQASSQAA